MHINDEWHASFEPAPDPESLAALAGSWNIGVDIKITNLCEYSSGPIELKGMMNHKQIHKYMNAESA